MRWPTHEKFEALFLGSSTFNSKRGSTAITHASKMRQPCTIYFISNELPKPKRKGHALAGSRTQVTSMGGLYDTATLRAQSRIGIFYGSVSLNEGRRTCRVETRFELNVELPTHEAWNFSRVVHLMLEQDISRTSARKNRISGYLDTRYVGGPACWD